MIGTFAMQYPLLTEGEKRIFHYMMDNQDQVIKMTSQAIAQECHVSKTVLITMAQKLGFEGFNDLKFYLKNENKSDGISQQQAIEHILQDNVSRTIQINSSEALDSVAHEILQSKTVYIIARGTSKAIASYFGHMLLTMNIKCIVNPDFNLLSIIAKSMERKELLIAMSLSGETKIVVETAKAVKMHGNKCIAITSFTNNSLVKWSDGTIYCVSDDVDTKVNDLITRISMFTAVELIVNRVKLRLMHRDKESIE